MAALADLPVVDLYQEDGTRALALSTSSGVSPRNVMCHESFSTSSEPLRSEKEGKIRSNFGIFHRTLRDYIDALFGRAWHPRAGRDRDSRFHLAFILLGPACGEV
jgi:hypothetical protein